MDATIIAIIFVVMSHFWGTQNPDEEGVITYRLAGLPFLAFLAIWFFVIPFAEGMTGQTIGKMVVQIKVLKQDTGSPSVGTSLVRHLFDVVDCFLLVGLIVAATNKEKKRVGDMVAGTHVIRK